MFTQSPKPPHLSKKQSYQIIKEGYLFKESYHLKTLRRRWIVLNHFFIDCYKDNVSDHTTEELDLNTFSDVRVCLDKAGQFELIPNEKNYNKPTRIFIADSIYDMNDWINNIKRCIVNLESHVMNGEEWNTREVSVDTKDIKDTETVQKTPEISISSLIAYTTAATSSDNSHHYTSSDLKQLSKWFTKELKKLEQKHLAEDKVLLSRINKLINEQTQMKKDHSIELKKRLNQTSNIDALENKCDSLQKELKQYLYHKKVKKQMDAILDEEDTKVQCDITYKYRNENNENMNSNLKKGLLIFQHQRVTVSQLHDIVNYYKRHGFERAPKIIFGDNDILEEYDENICYKIKTTFYGNKEEPTLHDFSVLINKQFEILHQYLLNGNDVIIPLPTSKDIELNGSQRFYKNNKQIVYHRIGIHKDLQLPVLFIELIQNKIDQLTKYCSSTQIVQYYVYDKVKYKEIVNKLNLRKAKQKGKLGIKYIVLWQWRNDNNKWISYDYKTCQRIETLALNGVYEYNRYSFITKITKDSGIYVDTHTEQRRNIKRIEKRMLSGRKRTKSM